MPTAHPIVSPFFRLPLELRQQIYEHIFGPHDFSLWQIKDRIYQDWRQPLRNYTSPLLLVNKAFNIDTKAFIFDRYKLHLRLDPYTTIPDSLRYRQSQRIEQLKPLLQKVRQIELHVTLLDSVAHQASLTAFLNWTRVVLNGRANTPKLHVHITIHNPLLQIQAQSSLIQTLAQIRTAAPITLSCSRADAIEPACLEVLSKHERNHCCGTLTNLGCWTRLTPMSSPLSRSAKDEERLALSAFMGRYSVVEAFHELYQVPGSISWLFQPLRRLLDW